MRPTQLQSAIARASAVAESLRHAIEWENDSHQSAVGWCSACNLAAFVAVGHIAPDECEGGTCLAVECGGPGSRPSWAATGV